MSVTDKQSQSQGQTYYPTVSAVRDFTLASNASRQIDEPVVNKSDLLFHGNIHVVNMGPAMNNHDSFGTQFATIQEGKGVTRSSQVSLPEESISMEHDEKLVLNSRL